MEIGESSYTSPLGAKIVAGALISFWFPIFLLFIWCTESFIPFAGHTFQVSLVQSVIRTILHCTHTVVCVSVCVCVHVCMLYMGFPGDSDSKKSTCNAGDLGSIPGLGRSP